MTSAVLAPSLMRRTSNRRKPAAWRLAAASLSALSLVSGCASLGGKQARLAEERGKLLADSEAKAAALETKVADLQKENAKLTRHVAELETDARAAQVASVTKPPEPPGEAAPALRGGQSSARTLVTATSDHAIASAASPGQAAPRLIQPTFASGEQTVFENEANSGGVPVTSVLFGAHLESYRRSADARAGWRLLQRKNPSELGLLEPRLAAVNVEGKGVFLRLIAGGFASQQKAAALCAKLKARGQFCEVTSFEGQKLSSDQ